MPEELKYERDLVRRAGHDPVALQTLYERYFDRVYRYVIARVNNSQDAEDIVSDIFVLVIKRLHQFRNNNKHSFAAWLFTIARHTIIDFYRRQGRLPTQVSIDDYAEQDTADAGLDEKLIRHERVAELRSLLQMLPKRRCEVVMLRYFGGLRNLEIAHILGIDERTVASHLSRGLNDLYKAYNKKTETSIGRENEE